LGGENENIKNNRRRSVMPLKATVKTEVEKKIEEYEGRYNHMYLDSKAKVTIGVGHLIANRNAVASLMLYTTKNNQVVALASLTDKQAEYDVIAKQKKNYKGSWYKQYTKLIMKDFDINAQRTKHLDTFYKELTNLYSRVKGYASDFDNMPDCVQKALFDMIFNLGATKLSTTFALFNAAIKKEEWDVAAKQCNRPDVNAVRNNYVKDLFTAAHNAKKTVNP
jgi:GH24 family phage-related lysozyme (muramidase)